MAYWWASQNKNYRIAIADGTLWTHPRIDGVLPTERRALQDLVPDDIVFHYGGPYVRAVSRVIAAAVDAPRPPGYPRGHNETEAHDAGRLARLELIAVGLELHRDDVAQLIAWGTPGPLSKLGVPREAYLTPLTDQDADAMLAALNVAVPTRAQPGRPHEDWAPGTGQTDAEAISRIRKEQGALRAHLLDRADAAPCAICGRIVPSSFLVAGHIVPRSDLSNVERRQFDAVAMLVCLFGCDTLFENGYLVVNQKGSVAAGRETDNRAVVAEVARRVGVEAVGWHPTTAAAFHRHESRHRRAEEPSTGSAARLGDRV